MNLHPKPLSNPMTSAQLSFQPQESLQTSAIMVCQQQLNNSTLDKTHDALSGSMALQQTHNQSTADNNTTIIKPFLSNGEENKAEDLSYGLEEPTYDANSSSNDDALNPSDKERRKRISSKSKVNFTKLTEKEKEERFSNMAKKIRRLKAQVRSLRKRCQTLHKKVKLRLQSVLPLIGTSQLTIKNRARPLPRNDLEICSNLENGNFMNTYPMTSMNIPQNSAIFMNSMQQTIDQISQQIMQRSNLQLSKAPLWNNVNPLKHETLLSGQQKQMLHDKFTPPQNLQSQLAVQPFHAYCQQTKSLMQVPDMSLRNFSGPFAISQAPQFNNCLCLPSFPVQNQGTNFEGSTVYGNPSQTLGLRRQDFNINETSRQAMLHPYMQYP